MNANLPIKASVICAAVCASAFAMGARVDQSPGVQESVQAMYSREPQFIVPPPSRTQRCRQINVRPFTSDTSVIRDNANVMEEMELHPKHHVFLCDFVKPTIRQSK